jgi:Fe-S cluster biogenesis protein NfuA/nitrite reductase/ring-hydroxylating ferredoxin subunit
MDDLDVREQVGRIDALLEQVEGFSDPAERETATELVAALLDLYGEGMSRLVEHVEDATALAEDELISHLLLLHGMHPQPVEVRVREALAEVRPYLESHGGGVELVELSEDRVRLRMQGSCDGCPSSSATLELAIEDAIRKHAPEIEHIDAEESAPAADGPTLIALAPLDPPNGASGAGGAGEWSLVGALPQLRGGGTLVKDVAGEPLLFCGLEDTFYAYHASCAGCRESLAGAELSGAVLACDGCGRRFEVTRAGRCADEPDVHLEPVPLLTDDAGMVKVALPARA